MHYLLIKSKRVIRSILILEIYRIVLGIDIAYIISIILNIIISKLNLLKIKIIIYIDSYSLYKYLVKLRSTKEKRLIINIISL